MTPPVPDSFELLEHLAQELDQTLSPSDTMFAGSENHYFSVGRSALRCIRSAQGAAKLNEPGNILDLPCGYGRVLRTMRAAWPTAEITACDLEREGVDFCARAFGAIPVYSDVDPRSVELLPGSFDLIWVGSLLTHLNRSSWSDFLECFERWLKPGGLLVFSTHGRRVAARMESGIDYGLERDACAGLLLEFKRDGFAYRDYPGQTSYGISLASPMFVLKELLLGDSWRIVSYGETMWDDHHDVVACQKIV